jgi:hypothetical protein
MLIQFDNVLYLKSNSQGNHRKSNNVFSQCQARVNPGIKKRKMLKQNHHSTIQLFYYSALFEIHAFPLTLYKFYSKINKIFKIDTSNNMLTNTHST